MSFKFIPPAHDFEIDLPLLWVWDWPLGSNRLKMNPGGRLASTLRLLGSIRAWVWGRGPKGFTSSSPASRRRDFPLQSWCSHAHCQVRRSLLSRLRAEQLQWFIFSLAQLLCSICSEGLSCDVWDISLGLLEQEHWQPTRTSQFADSESAALTSQARSAGVRVHWLQVAMVQLEVKLTLLPPRRSNLKAYQASGTLRNYNIIVCLRYHSFAYDIICNIMSIISYVWYCIWYHKNIYDIIVNLKCINIIRYGSCPISYSMISYFFAGECAWNMFSMCASDVEKNIADAIGKFTLNR